MKVFILATGADTGGAAIRVVEAFRALESGHPAFHAVRPPIEIHSMVGADTYIEYKQDVPHNRFFLEDLYDKSDVVMLNNTMAGHQWYDAGQGKPTILMHHGLHEGHFTQTLDECVQDAIDTRATQICSTVNLELYGRPGLIQWAPIPYPLEALAGLRATLYEPSDTIRIAHAPTDRSVKSTDAIIGAVKSLQSDGLPVELLLIERKTHAETLLRKAKYADILVDQLRLGYGNNAIEAWAMGIPVVGGVSDYPTWRSHMKRRYILPESPSGLPFYEANEGNLVQKLSKLVKSAQLRREWAEIGQIHVSRVHSEPHVVKLLSEIFEEAALQPTIARPGGGLMSRRTDHRLRLPRDERLRLLREANAYRMAKEGQLHG